MSPRKTYLKDDSLWYKDAIIYELHIKAFHDSNNDGIGDLQGLIKKLDYLQSLGVNAVWLLPFYPSPLRDDGYDIADYYSIHATYGKIQDFREFLKQAHKRGIRVITELVLNHTSDQHAWFQRARKAAPKSVWRNFYVWSDTPDKYKDARIIFQDFETSNWTWDPVAKAYYWHRFYSHQPDLNFENPKVQKEMLKVIDFWFDLGVDGLRLDAVPYLFEEEGTNCENLPQTHEFLKKVRAHVDRKYKNRMLLAEANQWPEDAIEYLGDGDECHMAFHFPVMPRMFMAVQMEDRFPLTDILDPSFTIPLNCQWALFLRNHDELTLEMVTDEERDYMYRVYAAESRAKINLGIRRRLAPLLGNNRRKIELMNILLFSLPGTPVLYYGDEIGMGDNYYLGDRDGVRTPMQWSPDRNAGFSKTNPHQLYLPLIIDPEYHYEALNVENQERNLSSLLWWMKRVIAMRKRFKAFSRGTLEFLHSENPKVLSFIRQYENERILVMINLSRFAQSVELDLSAYAGFVPRELFSQNKFPSIKKAPYSIMLGPHMHFWFLLEKGGRPPMKRKKTVLPRMRILKHGDELLEGENRELLELDILPAYMRSMRWFGGKGRLMRKVRITENLPVARTEIWTHFIFVEVAYNEGPLETYMIPLAVVWEKDAAQIEKNYPHALLSRIEHRQKKGVLFDGVFCPELHQTLLDLMTRRKRIKGERGVLRAAAGKFLRKLLRESGRPEGSSVLKAEQSNTSILYENTLILKMFRKLEGGMNPDPEIVRFLSERARFPYVPDFAGVIEYSLPNDDSTIFVGFMQKFIPNQGDAWHYALDNVGGFFDRILSRKEELSRNGEKSGMEEVAPEFMAELTGEFFSQMIALLGQRTAELHLALASEEDDKAFTPEAFSLLYQRSVYQSMKSLVKQSFRLLERNIGRCTGTVRQDALDILAKEKNILQILARILEKKISAKKIRIHGDYHLGQVLYTGKDFKIIDFEGEPIRALSERRLKRSPFRDVAGMVRSFHYAAYGGFSRYISRRAEDEAFLRPWVTRWYHHVSDRFLSSYMETAGGASFIPSNTKDLDVLLDVFVLEKAVYELGYELNNRPDWVHIPLHGIQYILQHRDV
ncbi:MAG: maltose alpha-D-glucosyltransferase [Candidatus Omnitrophica bacterium]|nr:maltose alpha-D-glucosyltransferase [Candidatus Omnitrophota bacterium]